MAPETETTQVAIIGAGWSGLSAAAALVDAGVDTVVVEKSRKAGGRSATRIGGDGVSWDHGAQYFTAREPEFAAVVQTWMAAGLVAEWSPRLEAFGEREAVTGRESATRYVGVPGMNTVPDRLATGLDCRWRWVVERLIHDDRHWILQDIRGRRLQAGRLVITAPLPQARALLVTAGLEQALAMADSVVMQPCWAVLASTAGRHDPGWDAAFVNDGPLAWVAADGSKPGRTGHTWVLHATAEWSHANLESDPEAVSAQLVEAVRALPGMADFEPVGVTGHRWRFARASSPLVLGCIHEPDIRLAVAGDWLGGDRVEGAWRSGRAAARALLGRR